MEMQSQDISELLAALAKAQSIMQGALKDSSNPYFKSQYADLTSVWEACRDPLTKNGLSVVQTMQSIDGQSFLISILGHSSGQWIKSMIPINPAKPDIQALGSAITYCRRYALAALVGVCPEDDDGESAMDRQAKYNSEKMSKNYKEDTVELKLPEGTDLNEVNLYIAQLKKEYKGYTLNQIKKSINNDVPKFLVMFEEFKKHKKQHENLDKTVEEFNEFHKSALTGG